MTKYLSTDREYSLVSKTLTYSLPTLSKTLLGVMPFFLGYTFFGLCLFWDSNRFDETSTTMFTLFAIMFGDMIWDTYNDVSFARYLICQLYLYTFVFFAVCVIQNVFLVVIEDGYLTTKYAVTSDNLWTTGPDEVPLARLFKGRFGLKDLEDLPMDDPS